MKKALCILLTMILAGLPYGIVAESLTVTCEEATVLQEWDDLSLQWLERNGGFVLVANWTAEGEKYELCLSNLYEQLTREQVEMLITAAMARKMATVTGPALIDAEKASNKLPPEFGEKLIQDEVTAQPNWGDSKHCWAGSLSDMLIWTGWGQQTINPVTGEFFRDEDDLQGYFNRVFENDGSHHIDSLRWFFTGEDSWNLATPRADAVGGFWPREDFNALTEDVRADEYDDVAQYMNDLNRMLEKLKRGDALGMTLQLNSIDYPLKDDDSVFVSYNPFVEAYEGYECFIPFTQEDVQEIYFVLNAKTGLVEQVLPDETTGVYTNAVTGEAVDENSIMQGTFVFNPEQQTWAWVDMMFCEEGEDWYYDCIVYYAADEVALDQPEFPTMIMGGDHAVTPVGYVMKLSEQEPSLRLQAIFLADSDNDAAIFQFTAENVRREERPDTYTMYPTERVFVSDGFAVSLAGYMEQSVTLPYSITSLSPVK